MLKFEDYELAKRTVIQPNFLASEFACPCCKVVTIDEGLVEKLQQIRSTFKRPLQIHSAYRCPKHNKQVGGASKSFHTKGLAVDFSFDGSLGLLDVFPTLVDVFNRVGVYARSGAVEGFFHVDDMSTPLYWLCNRTSGHKYKYFSTPDILLQAANTDSKLEWKKVRV